MSIVRYFPCYRITEAVGVSYLDASFKQQCACVCPAGMTLDGTTCKSKLASAGGKCAWNIDRPAGYTRSWSSASASALKLVSDCKVDVIVPADNYVADRRVNKYDSQTIPSDPRIEVVSSIEKVTLVDTWQQYLLQPQLELDNIEFRSFGVYNLTVRASDYDHQTSCDGCVAVVDTYPPHAVQSCATSSWGSKEIAPTELTSTDLQTAMTKEASFNAFSSDQNVVNNGPSERVDLVTRTMKDWVSSSYVTLASDSSSCFHEFVVRDLLNQPNLTQSPLSLGSTVLNSLKCMRCCSKQTTLREYYDDYKCGSVSSPPTKLIAGSETCSFNHCMRLSGSALVQVTASTSNVMALTDPLTITRNSSCPILSSSCSYTATLSSLINTNAAWNTSLPNQDGYLKKMNVSAYVFWRYKKGSDEWALWNDSAALEFTTSSTPLSVQAWTNCGMAKQFDFTVAISLSSTFLLSSTLARTGTSTTLNSSLLSLSKTPASCLSSDAMLGFRLNSVGGAQAYYTTQCAVTTTLSTAVTKYTGWASVYVSSTELNKLSAHTMDCGTAAISSFKLETQYQSLTYYIRYSYTCSSPLNPVVCNRNVLSSKEQHGDTAFYLDRQNVACPTDMYLAKTQLMCDSSTSLIWYQSTCCYYQRVWRSRTLYGVMVPTTIAGLSALQVSCLNGEAMNSFKFDYFAVGYTVNCLADPRLSPGQQLYTDWITNNGSIFSLTGHVMDCGNRALNGFQLEAKDGLTRYVYSCTKTSTSLTTCSQITTTTSTYTSNGTDSLDSINAACASDYLLTKLQLRMSPVATNSYSPYYQMTCCQPP